MTRVLAHLDLLHRPCHTEQTMPSARYPAGHPDPHPASVVKTKGVPAEPGWPDSSRLIRRRERRMRRYPPPRASEHTDAERATLIATTVRDMDTRDPAEIAITCGYGADTRGTVNQIIKAARTRLAERACEYVDLHTQAARVAAADGDAKPAEWALTHIAEGADRVVDAERAVPPGPSVQIGIALGGIQKSPDRTPFTAHDLPQLVETVEQP